MRKFICLIGLLTLVGCATKRIEIATADPATVSLVNGNNLNEVGEVLGKTPVAIDLNTVKGRVVKVSSPGKVTQYLLVTDLLGDNTKASLRLKDEPKPPEGDSGGAAKDEDNKEENKKTFDEKDLNVAHRLLLRAYQALAARKHKTAIEISHKLSQIFPKTSAPHIVEGLALMETGQRDLARSSFIKAKAIDPEDKDIDVLINLVQ
jgi:hypothetical protein